METFEAFHLNEGDAYVDFESMPPGPIAPFTVNEVTVTIRTTQQRFPSLQNVDWPVVVIPYSFVNSTPSGTNELMGVRSATGTPDGQSQFEIRFSEPQLRAGLKRNWDTSSLTRFYNSNGDLLGEHQNTINREFVGWIGDRSTPDSYVARIQIDGLRDAAGYHVGVADDLYFGQGEPAPPTGIVHGESARALFEDSHASVGDTLVDFEDVPNGPLRALSEGEIELSFATTLKRFPSMEVVDWPVVVIPYDFVSSTPSGTNELMGVRTASGLPDGQSRFEIRFSEPQRRAGVQRNWSTYSLTRFYSSSDELLGEHQNSVNREFVGFLAEGEDPSAWIARIVIDGEPEGGVTYQVGVADDLFFGSRPIDAQEPLRLLALERGEGREATVTWQPSLDEAWLEFSGDLDSWIPLDGPVAGDQWTGQVPEGEERIGFIRVRSTPPAQ